MKLDLLIVQLESNPASILEIALPDGRQIPAHFHVTEAGHVAKRFVDCGGTFRTTESCLLQVFIGSARDDGHRLTAGKLAHILELARPILPSRDLPVEVEYEAGVVSQFPVEGVSLAGDRLVLELGRKHTDCLAKDKCGIEESCGCGAPDDSAAGCGGAKERTGCC
jgi:hypothetical protein